MKRTFTYVSLLLLVSSLAGCSAVSDAGSGSPQSSDSAVGAGDSSGAGSEAPMAEAPAAAPKWFFLRLDDSARPPIVLELDKQKALELFGDEAARQIKLLDIDSTPMLTNVLTTIQNACGTSWQNNNRDPMFDCQLTPLGQSFGASWGTTPEFAMVRLLAMTPANANVTGTSLEDFARLVNENYPETFSFDFGDVLAENLGITKTSPLVPTSNLVLALQQSLLAPHPEVNNTAGTLPITMYDALKDMAPLAAKLGPSGAHPGILVPDDGSFRTTSNALLPNFKMRVAAQSNLSWVSGIDLSRGAGDMFLQEGNAALTFDFNDSQKFQLEGLAETPTVDMRFSLHELPQAVPSCTRVPDCKSNSPATPVPGTVWTYDSWLLEPIIARAAYLTYSNRAFNKCYFTLFGQCRMSTSIGQAPDPLGWSIFTSSLTFSDGTTIRVPPPQFLWELLTESGQVIVHDPTGDGTADFLEGQARPVYALHGVPIGLSGSQLVAQIRPTLQAQARQISDAILGRYWKNNNALDFFYRRVTPGGEPYLFFAAATDLRPDPANPNQPRAYTYARPGFFTSPDLSDASKVSATVIAGVDDTTHEKYRLPTGETVLYMQDDEGATYQVRFYVPDGAAPTEIMASVKKL
jgi:hypothetical protein